MPKEKKSACLAMSSEVMAARGISIMVPTGMSSSTPYSSATALMFSSTTSRTRASSSSKATSGIMISGLGLRPCFWSSAVAEAMAFTCMTLSSG